MNVLNRPFVRIARALGVPLKIAAKVDKADEAYFREKIEPLLSDPGVEFIGEINERSKTCRASTCNKGSGREH